jgi:hypothetical protein
MFGLLSQLKIIIRQIIKRPSREMSKAWKAEQLHDYEHEQDMKAGLY